MVFSSFTFLMFFLPFTVTAYYLLKKDARNGFLLFMSLVFYLWGGPQYVLVMIGVIIINYAAGRFIDKYDRNLRPKARKIALGLGIAANLAVLIVFKYTNFIIANVNEPLAVFGIDPIVMKEILLPIGISFYIFQSISYIVDVYRGDAPVQKNFFSLALYVSLFPQLVAGPIVRYNTVEKQLRERSVAFDAFSAGLKLFMVGLGKKILLANGVASVADTVFMLDPNHLSPATLWIGAIAYTLQIYFDFSGYSDMAIGLGMMFGFTFPVNFNYPYLSKSITEFWRRWHISLSTWFRDYLYIPLGGNRVPVPRMYLNLLIVFIATGIWHGANWTFLVWGLYHGFFIIFDKVTGFHKARRLAFLRWAAATFIVVIGWVIFRSESISQAWDYISVMLFIREPGQILVDTAFFVNWYYALVFAVGIFASTPVFRDRALRGIFVTERSEELKELVVNLPKPADRAGTALTAAQNVFFLLIAAACFLQLANSSYNPFIYFRF